MIQLMYFVVHTNEAIFGNWVCAWSVGYNNCKCHIDAHLNFPELSSMSNALSDSHLQI